MSDRSLGSLIFALGLIGAILYVYWLFGPIPTGWEALFVAPEWMQSMRWAVIIPLVVAVLAVLFIAMWIGGLIVGAIAAAITYPLMLRAVVRLRTRRARRRARRRLSRR